MYHLKKIKKRYEKFRAICDPNIKDECIMTLENKSISYNIEAIKDCSVIPSDILLYFKDYALKRGVKKYNNIYYYINLHKNRNKNDEYKQKWIERNKKCYKLINKMKSKAIPSIEQNGIHKNYPTIKELELMSYLCSNLNKNKLDKIIQNNLKIIKYKFNYD